MHIQESDLCGDQFKVKKNSRNKQQLYKRNIKLRPNSDKENFIKRKKIRRNKKKYWRGEKI